jgi:hypothetical protein
MRRAERNVRQERFPGRDARDAKEVVTMMVVVDVVNGPVEADRTQAIRQ